MPITIITHFYPDIDAILGVWLLKRYGQTRYPGIEDATICLVPAGPLSQEFLRQRGLVDPKRFIAVDTGHCDFDTHGRVTEEKSASLLVAEDLGVDQQPSIRLLLQFVEANESTGESVLVGDSFAQSFLWPNLIKGIHLYKSWREPQIFSDVFNLLDAAVAFVDFSPQEIGQFWHIEDNDEDNPQLKALIETWWCQSDLNLPHPFEKTGLMELLGYIKDDYPPICRVLRQFLSNRKLFEFVHNRERYNLLYIKNSLIGTLVSVALQKLPTDEILKVLAPCFQGLLFSELEWSRVAHDVEQSECLMTYPFKTKKKKSKFNFVFADHPSPLITKVIRHKIKHAAILLTINSEINSVAIGCSRPGPLQHTRLNLLASLLRRGEAFASGEKWSLTNHQARGIGTFFGWYLHDSERMLMRGSLKSPAAQPTRMTRQQLVNLVAVFLDENVPVSPSLGCPGLCCKGKTCPFSSLLLPLCQLIQTIIDRPLTKAKVLPLIENAKQLRVY